MGISAYGRVRDWKRALSLLAKMGQRGVSPDVINFNAVISACREGGQLERALSPVEEMRGSGLSPTSGPSSSRWVPSGSLARRALPIGRTAVSTRGVAAEPKMLLPSVDSVATIKEDNVNDAVGGKAAGNKPELKQLLLQRLERGGARRRSRQLRL